LGGSSFSPFFVSQPHVSSSELLQSRTFFPSSSLAVIYRYFLLLKCCFNRYYAAFTEKGCNEMATNFGTFSFLLFGFQERDRQCINNSPATLRIAFSPCFFFHRWVAWAQLLEETRDSRISSASKWISEGLTRNFVFGFFLTAYISFVRSPLIELNPYVAIAEWVVVALAVALVYINVKMVFEEHDPVLENTEWKKHIQEVERETGNDFKHLTFVQEQFVNQGIKEPLLVYLTLFLRDLGKSEKQIIRTIAPLLHYRNKKTSVFALPLVKENLKRRNKESRKKILEDFMARF
jgi:uncharacterized membrane protein YhdT